MAISVRRARGRMAPRRQRHAGPGRPARGVPNMRGPAEAGVQRRRPPFFFPPEDLRPPDLPAGFRAEPLPRADFAEPFRPAAFFAPRLTGPLRDPAALRAPAALLEADPLPEPEDLR